MNCSRLSSLCLAALLVAGCESGPLKDVQNPFVKTKGETMLKDGLSSYEDGNYRQAGRQIKAALDEGLRMKSDRVTAHKYLAFINCVSAREVQCRAEFRQALTIDPNFTLTAAEAGHPTWGPVFRIVRDRAP